MDGSGILNEQSSDAASCPSFLSLFGTEADATSGRTCYTGDVAEPLFEDSGSRGRISGKGEGINPLLPRVNFQLYVKGPSEAKTSSDHAAAYFADERRILPGSVGVSLLVGDMDSLETEQSPAATTSTRFSRCVFGDQQDSSAVNVSLLCVCKVLANLVRSGLQESCMNHMPRKNRLRVWRSLGLNPGGHATLVAMTWRHLHTKVPS